MSDTTFPYDDEVADPYADDDTKNPHEATGGDEEPAEEETDDGVEAPAKRRPGRPRKNAG